MACSPIGQEDRRRNQFDKINNMNTIANRIAEQFCGAALVTEMNEKCGIIPAGSYETVVDQSRAHKHLTQLMNTAELRFAWAVTATLQNGKVNLPQLEQAVRACGAENAVPAGADIEYAYQWFLGSYLDGMPCDHTKDLIGITADAASWSRAEDVHAALWAAADGDYSNYEPLLLAYADGMLSGAGFTLKIENHRIFTICRK